MQNMQTGLDAIVSDICMPGPTGLEILEDLHDNKGLPPIILITAFGDKSIHVRAKLAGAVAVLDKPFGIETLLAKLHTDWRLDVILDKLLEDIIT